MDKCVCVVYLFYTRVQALMPCVFFAFAHGRDMCVPFKLWMICTVFTIFDHEVFLIPFGSAAYDK